ncbi:hypothetical protein C8255_17415 [filamentous cyanobacterium CCP3]|nr:hypothetical protein C8255_17415 [filamentous cyanobacterium CCP3]
MVEQRELAWGKKLEAAADLAYQAALNCGYRLSELKNSYWAAPLALTLGVWQRFKAPGAGEYRESNDPSWALPNGVSYVLGQC